MEPTWPFPAASDPPKNFSLPKVFLHFAYPPVPLHLPPSCATCRHLVPILAPSCAILGPFCGHLGPILGPFWALLGPLLASLGPLSASFGRLGAIRLTSFDYHTSLKPSGGHLGPFRVDLQSSWGRLGLLVAPPVASFGPLSSFLRPSWGLLSHTFPRQSPPKSQETRGGGRSFLPLRWPMMPSSSLLKPILAQLGPILEPSWPQLGLFRPPRTYHKP